MGELCSLRRVTGTFMLVSNRISYERVLLLY